MSGDSDIIERMQKDLKAQSIRCKILNVAAAFHSPHMQFLEPDMKRTLSFLSSSDTVLNQTQARERYGVQWRSTVYPDEKDTLKPDENYWFVPRDVSLPSSHHILSFLQVAQCS